MVDSNTLATIVWGILTGLLITYIAYRILRLKPKPTKPLPFLQDQRPWILLVRPEEEKESPFAITIKRLAYAYQIPIQEATPDKSPYPLPRHIQAVVFQGRFLWFTKNTFDKDHFLFSLSAAKEHWNNYMYSYRQSLSRSVSVLTPGLFATHGAEFADSYVASAFYDPDSFTISEEGSIETDEIGIPYHKYMEEGLKSVGANVRDLRSLTPVRDYVYVTRPRHIEENM